MTIEPGSVEHLSQLISHVLAPAFLLGAVGSFISLLHDRLLAVVARVRELSTSGDAGLPPARREQVLAELRRRAKLINVAIFFGALSGLSALVLIIASFAAALMDVHHVWLAALLFMVSSFFLLCSLVTFLVDVRLAISAHDLH